jgi:predicted esterase
MIVSILGWTHTEKNASNATRRFVFEGSSIRKAIGVAIWYEEGSWIYPHWSNPNAFAATKAVMDKVRADHSVDPKRIFLFCFSQGGNAVEKLVWGNTFSAKDFPFAGLIFCSAVFEGEAKLNNPMVPKNIPIFIEYGDVSAGEYAQMPGYSESLFKALKSAGYTDVEKNKIKGQGHVISDYDSKLKPNAQSLIAAWWKRVDAAISQGVKPAQPTQTTEPKK